MKRENKKLHGHQETFAYCKKEGWLSDVFLHCNDLLGNNHKIDASFPKTFYLHIFIPGQSQAVFFFHKRLLLYNHE